MNGEEQFQIFKMLMLLALKDSNSIFYVCAKLIVSLSIINEHTDEEFEEILDYIRGMFNNTPSREELMEEFKRNED